jgi:hypothetical protein
MIGMATSNKQSTAALVAQLTDAVAALRAELAATKEQAANSPREKKESKAGKPRENVTYAISGCFKKEAQQPPQCKQLSTWAWEARQKFGRDLTEPELFAEFETHADEWNRRNTQPIWHVWQYYRPRMIQAGHVRMF